MKLNEFAEKVGVSILLVMLVVFYLLPLILTIFVVYIINVNYDLSTGMLVVTSILIYLFIKVCFNVITKK